MKIHEKTWKNISDVFGKRKTVYLSVSLFLIALAIRLYFINVNHAEYTLGVILMNYSKHLDAQIHFDVLYPLIIHIFNLIIPDIELASKLVAIISGALSAPILFLISQQLLKNFRVSYIAGLLLATQPIHMYWSIRVTADTLFLFCFMLAIYLFLMDMLKSSSVILALVTLTKFEGSILFLVLLFHLYINKKYNKCISLSLYYIPITLLWIFSKSGSSVNRVTIGVERFDLIHVIYNIIFYSISFFYTYTIPIGIFIIVGMFVYSQKHLSYNPHNFKNFDYFLHVIRDIKFLPIIIIISYYSMNFLWPWVQFRHSLPMIVILLIFGAYGVEMFLDIFKNKIKSTLGEGHLSNVAIYVFIIILLTFLTFHSFNIGKERIYDNSEYFGDIRDAAVWISENAPYDAILYSNEPKKIKFYSGRNVHDIINPVVIKGGEEIKVYFIISDYYASIKPLNESFEKEHELIPIKTFKAEIKYSYPSAGTNIVSQTYEWFPHRNDVVQQETTIYILS